MQLSEYIKRAGMSDEEFAERIGASIHGLRKWKYGTRMPRRDALAKIQEETGGQVTANDFLIPQAIEAAE